MDGFCFELMEWLEVISVALLAAFVLTTIVFVVGFFLLFACLQDQMDEEEDLFRGLMWTLPVLLLCSCAPHRDYTKVVIEDSLRIERLVAHPIEPKESSLEAWMECDEMGRVLLSKIKELEDKLADYEDKWYAKFADMETAMAKMQNNASAVTSLLGGS